MDTSSIYADIAARTGGNIYIGVVGPVRTGKSTFIKRFMETLVLPNITDEYVRERARDELPQSGSGRTIMTAEPKFVPEDAVSIELDASVRASVRLIDSVGYMIPGANGQYENGEERLVTTPWYDHEIPFTQAAELGTRKVITDHSTIGVVVTTDGSFSDLPQETYLDAENQAISELKKLHKPFLVLVNSSHPSSRTAREAAERIEKQHSVAAMPVNCAQLSEEDIRQIMEQILYEFPVSRVEFYMPKWVEMLPFSHPLKTGLIEKIRELTGKIRTIRDVAEHPIVLSSEYVRRCMTERIDLADGCVRVLLDVEERYYYEMLSEYAGEKIENAQELLHTLRVLSGRKQEYDRVASAMEAVHTKGYGVVLPCREEIHLEQPEVIRHGNKFGVKIRAESPSLHFIRATVVTEIAPIVGTEQQAKDLIGYIDETGKQDGIWETNIFGKTVEQLVNDGIRTKISMIGEESQEKLQDTMQKIVNDSTGGMVCIII